MVTARAEENKDVAAGRDIDLSEKAFPSLGGARGDREIGRGRMHAGASDVHIERATENILQKDVGAGSIRSGPGGGMGGTGTGSGAPGPNRGGGGAGRG
eukprot:tig00000190_g13865.t1